MARVSETTVGQRIQQFNNIVAQLKTMPDYYPSADLLKIVTLEQLSNNINAINNSIMQKDALLIQLRENRQNDYRGTNSVVERCKRIRDYIASMDSGKNNATYQRIRKIVASFHSSTKKKTTTDENGITTSSLSQSELSFGSILRKAEDVLIILKSMPNYQPMNMSIQILELETFLQSVGRKNTEIDQLLGDLKVLRLNRSKLYNGDEGIGKLTVRIKAYILGQYGKNSNEYARVKPFMSR